MLLARLTVFECVIVSCCVFVDVCCVCVCCVERVMPQGVAPWQGLQNA